MELEIDVDAIAGVLVVAVRGDVIRHTLAKLRECLDRAVGGGRPVVVDLIDVGNLDGAGVQLLLDVDAALGAGLRVVAESGGSVHRSLKAAGLSQRLALHRSRAIALTASVPASA